MSLYLIFIKLRLIFRMPIKIHKLFNGKYKSETSIFLQMHHGYIEDFAQVFGVYPQDKYKKASMRNIAQVIGIEGQDEDIAEFTRRLVFNTLIGNADMHLKNWSVIYKDRRTASIAPAYDFVSTIPYISDDSASLKVSRSKKFSDFTLDELSHLAAKAMLPEKLVLDTAKQTVAGFYEVWAKEKSHLPLTKSMIEAIDKHLRSVPLRY